MTTFVITPEMEKRIDEGLLKWIEFAHQIMINRQKRESLKVQLLETRRLKELAAGHPLMVSAFEEREKDLEAQIEGLPLGDKEAKRESKPRPLSLG